MRHLPIIPAVIFVLALTFCPGAALSSETPSWNAHDVILAMESLQFGDGQVYSDTANGYFEYYGIAFEDVQHNFGTIPAPEFTIASHIYRPPDPIGTVYVAHGYLDHTGLLSRLIQFLLKKGFAVVSYDMPGHGLSSGQQAGVDDFSQYSEVFTSVYEVTREHMPQPHNLVAHSTGCSMALDLIQESESLPFERIVMLAPLVRSAFYGWSRAGTEIAGSLVNSVGRKFRKNSSDKEFVQFVKKDPLQSRTIPMTWVRALHAWNDRIQEYKMRSTDVLIIQGNKDVIVQWKYNLEFLSEKLPNARIEIMEGANHQLMNESEQLRTRVFDMIGGYLLGQEQ